MQVFCGEVCEKMAGRPAASRRTPSVEDVDEGFFPSLSSPSMPLLGAGIAPSRPNPVTGHRRSCGPATGNTRARDRHTSRVGI
jgi:hypothetical protein